LPGAHSFARARPWQGLLQRQCGFTLLECLVAAGLAALLAAMAWPALRSKAPQAARLDAVQALMAVQAAQENYRAAHGGYAASLSALNAPGLRAQAARPVLGAEATVLSAQGHYRLELQQSQADHYTAFAVAVAPAAQRHDTACSTLSLQVRQGFGTEGPHARCWHR